MKATIKIKTCILFLKNSRYPHISCTSRAHRTRVLFVQSAYYLQHIVGLHIMQHSKEVIVIPRKVFFILF